MNQIFICLLPLVLAAPETAAELRERLIQETIALSDSILASPGKLDLHSRRGDAYFFAGEFAWAAADYDAMVKLEPKLASEHWRRGIACFYAGRFADAARQFEAYHSFDDVDRENGIWRYFSQAKAYGLEKARAGLLKYKKDDREPFGDVYRLFDGTMSGEAVLQRIEDARIADDERDKRRFYARLYIGLNDAIEGRDEAARGHLREAAARSWPREAGYGPSYMWHVGRVHLEVLERAARRARGEEPPERPARAKRVAAVITEYRHNSHADVIVSRLLQTDTLDGKGRDSALALASLYADQRPESDSSRMLAASHRFPIFDSIGEALTLGSGALAVDGVLLVAEHGRYPRSPTGNTQYPKRRFFDEIAAVFKASGRAAPIFCDKHLADNWEDAKHVYDGARALGAPLMAGSSLPTTWRRPAADVERDAELAEIVVLTFGSTDHYGFHALEIAQCLAEQRRGGETGIRAVQCLSREAVWKALEDRVVDRDLFTAAFERLPRRIAEPSKLAQAVPEPLLFRLEYADGLRAHVLELNGAVGEWTAAWRTRDGRSAAAQFWTQEGRPAMHFTQLLRGVEDMMLGGAPSWPAERTLMTSGALDALLQSRLEGGKRIETPYLEFSYRHPWRWRQPPPPPPARPWAEQ